MNSNYHPYIGVTGITNISELEEALDCAREAGITRIGRRFMVGYLVTPDLLIGNPPKRRRFVPDMPQLLELTQASTRAGALSVVHFETKDIPECEQNISELFRYLYTRGTCQTVQINGTPDADDVRRIRKQFPDLTLIYQIRTELLAHGADAVAAELGKHQSAFKRFLIDPSCGHGRDMDIKESVAIARRIMGSLSAPSIGFAGGFCGENARSQVSALIKEFGTDSFSIDAEGKLRNEHDALEMHKVRSYLNEAVKGFRS
jgi:hypothetical protein